MSSYDDQQAPKANEVRSNPSHAPLPKRVGDAGKPKGLGPAPKSALNLKADEADAASQSATALGASLELAANHIFDVADRIEGAINNGAGELGPEALVSGIRKEFDEIADGNEIDRIETDCRNANVTGLARGLWEINGAYTRIDGVARTASTFAAQSKLPSFRLDALRQRIDSLAAVLGHKDRTVLGRSSGRDEDATVARTISLHLRAANTHLKLLRDVVPTSESTHEVLVIYHGLFAHVAQLDQVAHRASIAPESKVAIVKLANELERMLGELAVRAPVRNEAERDLSKRVASLRVAAKS